MSKLTKEEFEVEDPMELVGAVIPGDENTMDNMATAIVEEYIMLGWDEERLMTLFVNPLFMATHRIYRYRGHEYVQSLIRETAAKFRIPARPQETDIFAPVEPIELHSDHGRVTIQSPYHNHAHAPESGRTPISLSTDPVPDPGSTFVPLDTPASDDESC